MSSKNGSNVTIVTLSDEDSESDSDIDILEDLSKHSSGGNTNDVEADDSNDSDDIQYIGVVLDTDIQVLKQIQPNEHNTDDIEIIDEKRGGSSGAQTSCSSDNKLQTVSQKPIKKEIKTEFMTIDDDEDEFGGDNVISDFNNSVTIKSDEITPSEVIDDKSNVDDISNITIINNNDNTRNDDSVASIAEKCDHMSIENCDQTVEQEVRVVVEEESSSKFKLISELVTDLNLKDDNGKNICTAKDDNNISSAQSVVLNINLSSVNEDVDSCLSSNTDICDTSFEFSANNGNSSVSVANTTISANTHNQNSVIDSTASISVDNTTTHQKKSLIPSDLRPKPKCKKKKPENRYECLRCDFVTYNLVHLVYHNSEHRNTFKCKHQLCSYQTDTKDKLDRHITKHDSMKRMCFPCMKQTMICDCGECDQSSKSVVEQLTT